MAFFNNLTYKKPLAYNNTNRKGAIEIDNNKMIILTEEQEKNFTNLFKIGILKELHKKKLLTDEQLRKLIEMQK